MYWLWSRDGHKASLPHMRHGIFSANDKEPKEKEEVMAYSQSRWRNIARPIIRRVIQENAGKPEADVRRALRVAYPFGMKKYHPYKVWLDEIAIQMGKRGALGKGKYGPRTMAQLAGIDVTKAFLGPRILLKDLIKGLDSRGKED